MVKLNTTYQEYISRINRVIDYINRHYAEPFLVSELARLACFSEFHFQRVFKMITGEPLNAYIKRCRLEKAAARLSTNPSMPITDIALMFGFSTSANFSKAFRQHFDQSPSEFREFYQLNSRNGKMNSKIGKDIIDESGEHITIRYDEDELKNLDIVVKDLPARHIAYVRTLEGYDITAIDRAWDRLIKWAKARNLLTAETIALGIEHDDPFITGKAKCRYDACITVPEHINDFQGEIGIQDLAAGRHVVNHFTIREPIEIEIGHQYIKTYNWLAHNGYVPGDSSPYTIIINPDEMEKGLPGVLEICVPVEPL